MIRFSLFLIFAALGGAAITVQAGLNAQVARTLGHPLWATMVSLIVSIISILPMLVLFRAGPPTISTVLNTPWWIWIGGALGAFFITVALTTAPELGAVVFIAAVVMGQMIVSLMLDQFAIAGFPSRPITVMRVVGVMLVIAGVVISAWAAQAANITSPAALTTIHPSNAKE
jgi:transporter family-2 protein